MVHRQVYSSSKPQCCFLFPCLQGEKAFEGLAAHVPTGMLGRLKLVAERRQNQIMEAPQNFDRMPLRETTNPERAETFTTLRRRPGSKKSRRRCRQQSVDQQHPVDTPPGVAAVSSEGGAMLGVNNGPNRNSVTEQDRQTARRTRGEQESEGDRERTIEVSWRGAGSVAGVER